MARPLKSGLDYFPLDVDFLHDRKVRRIVRRNGCAGIGVIIALFCEIYRGKGYYVVWDEDLCFDICDQTECTTDQVESIFQSCLEAHLFDPELYASQHILTSCALQQRYIKINQDCKRKRTIDPAYCLFTVDEVSQKENTNAASSQPMNVAGISGLSTEQASSADERAFVGSASGLPSEKVSVISAADSRNEKAFLDAANSESPTENASVTAATSKSASEQIPSAADRNRVSSKLAEDKENTPFPDADKSAFVSSEVTRGEGRVSSEKMPQNKRKESKGQENKAQHIKREKNRPQQTACSPTGKAGEGAASPVVKSLSSSQNFDNQDDIEVKPILKLNLDALNVKNAKTVQAINALSQRPEIGGLNGVLWKVLSMQYRPLLVRKENPGDYILWALNHPEMFTETYTHFLQKKCRG